MTRPRSSVGVGRGRGYGVAVALLLTACNATDAADPPTDASPADAGRDVRDDDAVHPDVLDARDVVEPPTDVWPDTSADAEPDAAFTVVTFNVGTTPGLPHNSDDRDRDDVYSADTASLVDEHYNNSLAWMPAERHLVAWIGEQRPALIAMQELFYDPWCDEESIPVFPGLELICEVYEAGAPLQVERLLGPDYQVACGLRKPDTCLGVRRSFGAVRQCPGSRACIGGLEGTPPPSGCTSRDRAGRVHIARPDGSELIVVALHGTSGGSVDDTACRLDIFEQIWLDRGDGEPLVGRDSAAIVLGDFNTDPVLFVEADPSAAFLAATIGQADGAWRWHSPVDPAGPRSYALATIDHVVSNAFDGGCVIPGSSPDVAPVWDRVFWDHRPVVCTLTPR